MSLLISATFVALSGVACQVEVKLIGLDLAPICMSSATVSMRDVSSVPMPTFPVAWSIKNRLAPAAIVFGRSVLRGEQLFVHLVVQGIGPQVLEELLFQRRAARRLSGQRSAVQAGDPNDDRGILLGEFAAFRLGYVSDQELTELVGKDVEIDIR